MSRVDRVTGDLAIDDGGPALCVVGGGKDWVCGFMLELTEVVWL